MYSAIYNNGIKIAGSNRLPEHLPDELLFSKLPCYLDGVLYFSQDNDTVGGVMMDRSAAMQAIENERAVTQPSNEGIFKAALHNSLDLDHMTILAKRVRIRLDERRTVMCIMPEKTVTEAMCQTLRDIFAQEDSVVVEMDSEEIDVVSSSIPEADLPETAGALRETFLNDFNTDVHIGIGESVANLVGISSSRRTAREAITIGRRLSYEGGIWQYNRMLPEILLSGISEDIIIKHSELIMRIQHTIDDETQSLLDELFKQNLNISQTAKELFMHRNTLIYRLDKIRKSAGLDATCFDDAVTLRLILALARLNYKD